MKVESKVIPLNPGIVVNGKPVTEFKVRLLTFGEIRSLEQIAEEENKRVLSLVKHISFLGDKGVPTVTEVTEDILGLFLMPDIERIDQAINDLSDSFRASNPKVRCPRCSYEWGVIVGDNVASGATAGTGAPGS